MKSLDEIYMDALFARIDAGELIGVVKCEPKRKRKPARTERKGHKHGCKLR
jgi:hypothetical protein